MSYPTRNKKAEASEPTVPTGEQIAAARQQEYWKAINGGETLTTWQKAEGQGWRKWDLSPHRKKKATSYGESHKNAKLSDEKVSLIIEEYRNGATGRSLATKHRVSESSMCALLAGKTWTHIPRESYVRGRSVSHPRGEQLHNAVLKDSQIQAIRQASRSGMSRKAIATQYGVGKNTIARILNGESWTHIPDHDRELFPDTPDWKKNKSVAKLNPALVAEIRRKYCEKTHTSVELANQYGVGRSTITRIIARRTWKDVP